MTSTGAASGGDARVPDNRLHAVLGHQLQFLQFGDAPLLLTRERGCSFQRLQLDVVVLVLVPEAAEFLVLGHESLDEALLGHPGLLARGVAGCRTNKASASSRAGFAKVSINQFPPSDVPGCGLNDI